MNTFEQGHIIAEIILAEKERPLTEKEQEQLEDWFAQDSQNFFLYEKLKYDDNLTSSLKELGKLDTAKAYSAFEKRITPTKTIKLSHVIMRVAAVLVILVGSYYLFQYNFSSPQEDISHQVAIKPGTSKAILKLADGTVVSLENKKTEIKELDGTTISSDTNKVVYTPSEKRVSERKLQYNTIEIPRGGEYQLTLSDGTHVWLNSETTIKYPVVFAKNKREVFINGEAFFDVAHNEEVPFIVSTNKMKVNVLGTAFNIRAFDNENEAATTLVRGKVNVTSTQTAQTFLLKPSEQFLTGEGNSSVRKVDVNHYIAWKEGRIFFEDNTLDEIFSDIARWYNIDVKYQNDALKNLRFSVDVKRYDEISKITEIIELTKKVKFELNNETINILELD
ncbi:FecR domain-containing protein [Draconibacterium sp. IB214405]|uniref:FecR family protein n=1 Tax=Draconibacterium sp. IB214405 TaxID=3097352 RepID=UPI002A120DA5|nr:FecR domain-containing protein [Draconibacterium sp. IB214405]MDX8338938.1 FecR domain-containing protein [Draconibacterium sp. IB214405]